MGFHTIYIFHLYTYIPCTHTVPIGGILISVFAYTKVFRGSLYRHKWGIFVKVHSAGMIALADNGIQTCFSRNTLVHSILKLVYKCIAYYCICIAHVLHIIVFVAQQKILWCSLALKLMLLQFEPTLVRQIAKFPTNSIVLGV